MCCEFREGKFDLSALKCWYMHDNAKKNIERPHVKGIVPTQQDFPNLPEPNKLPEPVTKTSVNMAELEEMVKKALLIITNVDGKLKLMKNKSLLYDHIADVYNVLNTKYGKGLYWCIAGDTNQIKLNPILHLSTNLKSVVAEPTRINHKNPKKSSILDNIITDLHKWYQKPILLPPIAADPGQGRPSDHLTVVYKPLTPLMNKSNRKGRSIKVSVKWVGIAKSVAG